MSTTLTVRELHALQKGIALPRFLVEHPARLPPESRQSLLATLTLLLDQVYAHLPAKRARYGTDPVQRLRVLALRSADMTEDQFEHELFQVIVSLRDAHTTYAGPAARRPFVAVLPFLAEAYGPTASPTFITSKIGPKHLVTDPTFGPEAELIAWNGIPFARAVTRWGENEAGGRPDSQLARALQSLTFRALGHGPPPDEHWVIITYRPHGQRKAHEVRFEWRAVNPYDTSTLNRQHDHEPVAIDNAADAIRRAKQLLFAPQTWAESTGRTLTRPRTPRRNKVNRTVEIETPFPQYFRARIVTLRNRKRPVSHLRLWTFQTQDVDQYLDEAARLLGLLADHPLIVDLRGNPGGRVAAAERLLQLLTPNHIEPTRFAWRATPLLAELATRSDNPRIEPWRQSIISAVETGETYAQPRPLTDPARCNDRSQIHPGPVLAVVDALTYSAGDLFAAGFADNNIGPIICAGASATGAGGADVLDYPDLHALLKPALPAPLLTPMAELEGFTFAARRSTRTGPSDSMTIEDAGVAATPHRLTRQDLLEDNSDLLRRCSDLLNGSGIAALTHPMRVRRTGDARPR